MSYSHGKSSGTDLVVNVPGRGQINVELKWKVIHNRPEVVALTVTALDDTTPLEPVVLRNLPLAAIIKRERPKFSEAGNEPLRPTDRPHGTRRTLSEADLRHVADLYMTAWQQGLSVQRYVADQRGIALSTAARQILLARKRGLINKQINPPRRKK